MADRTLAVLSSDHGPSCGTGSPQQCDEPRDLAPFDLGFSGTRCTTNPLGVKGCGEAGAVAAGANLARDE